MWCLIYIAIAGTAPPIDCSILYEEQCKRIALTVNDANWREDVSTISYLVQCVSAQAHSRYLIAQQVEKAKEYSR